MRKDAFGVERTSILLNIGKSNFVMSSRILAITVWDSSTIKKSVQNAKKNDLLIDATCGRRTRSVIFLDNSSIVLSSVQPETLAVRISGSRGSCDTGV